MPWNKFGKISNIFLSVIIYFLALLVIQAIISKNYYAEYLVSSTVVCIPMLIAICYLRSTYQSESSVSLRTSKVILYSIAGIILCVLINYPFNVINKVHVKPSEYSHFISYSTVFKIYFLLLLGVIGPVIEEFYFRAFLYNILKKEFGVWTGVIASSFLFMILHGHLDLIYLFIPGVIYALVYEKTKTIWASVVVHGFNNLIWFSLVYYA